MISLLWYVPVWIGLTVIAAVSARRVIARSRNSHQAGPAPAPPVRRPADPRAGMTSLSDQALQATCPVCGMEDAERFKVGVGTAKWHGWNVHSSCLEWLGEPPSDAPPAGRAFAGAGILSIDEVRAGTLGALRSGTLTAGPGTVSSLTFQPVPAVELEPGQVRPAPHAVMLRFPGITADEVQFARNVQRRGHPILVTRAEPGDKMVLMYGLPDVPYQVSIAGQALEVAGGGPLDGGYTVLWLSKPVETGMCGGLMGTAISKAEAQRQAP